MKVLLLEGGDVLRELITLGLMKEFSAEVLGASTASEAIAIIKKEHRTIDCIIIDYEKPEKSIGKIQEFLSTSRLNFPIVICSNEGDLEKLELKNITKLIEKPDVLPSLEETLTQILKLQKEPKKQSPKKYFGVKLKTLLKINKSNVDLYLKLTEEKYVKVLKKGDYFGKEDSQKYKKKKVDEFYVMGKDLASFIEQITRDYASLDDLSRTIESPDVLSAEAKAASNSEVRSDLAAISVALKKAKEGELSFEDSYKMAESTHKTIYKVVDKLGANREVQALTKATVGLAVQTMNQHPGLNKLFEKVKMNPDSYINSHSVMLANICCGIAAIAGWNSDLTYYKLTMAAFIHDLTLKNHEMARLQTIADLAIKGTEFSDAEAEMFINHPLTARKLLLDFRMIPPDVDLIVAQHHERPDGSGFPKRLNFEKLSPLTCVFIIGHDLVNYIVDHKYESWNLVSFLNRYRQQYQEGVFKQIFWSLWNTLVHSTQPKEN